VCLSSDGNASSAKLIRVHEKAHNGSELEIMEQPMPDCPLLRPVHNSGSGFVKHNNQDGCHYVIHGLRAKGERDGVGSKVGEAKGDEIPQGLSPPLELEVSLCKGRSIQQSLDEAWTLVDSGSGSPPDRGLGSLEAAKVFTTSDLPERSRAPPAGTCTLLELLLKTNARLSSASEKEVVVVVVCLSPFSLLPALGTSHRSPRKRPLPLLLIDAFQAPMTLLYPRKRYKHKMS